MIRRALLLGLAAPLFVACASTQLPIGQSTVTSASNIKAAEEVGAQQNADASLYLRLAQEKYAAAQKQAANNEPEKADLLFREASADAETAIALAKEAAARADADRSIKKLHDLSSNPQATP